MQMSKWQQIIADEPSKQAWKKMSNRGMLSPYPGHRIQGQELLNRSNQERNSTCLAFLQNTSQNPADKPVQSMSIKKMLLPLLLVQNSKK